MSVDRCGSERKDRENDEVKNNLFDDTMIVHLMQDDTGRNFFPK